MPVEEPSTASIADVLPHKLVTLMKTMRLADNSHYRFKRWFDKHPAKPSSSTVHRDLGHIPPALPLLLPARSQLTAYDRLACRLACEQIGFWAMDQELTHRLVNACKIGCDVGQDHCL